MDLKAGIRFLRHFAGAIPGDMEKIVSVGISAGGAMSTLLGATGNSRDYEEELKRAGAFMDEMDDIFAAQCYCPIIDLDHADLAYEWLFRGETHYMGMPFVGFGEGNLTPYGKALSDRMADAYPEYFNSLGLTDPKTGAAVIIGKKLEGSGYAYLMKKLEQSAAKYLKRLEKGDVLSGARIRRRTILEGQTEAVEKSQSEFAMQKQHTESQEMASTKSEFAMQKQDTENQEMASAQKENVNEANLQACVTPAAYITGDYEILFEDHRSIGENWIPGLDKSSWLSWTDDHAMITGLKDMQKTYHRRLKLCPAFDDLNLIQAENQEFGTSECDRVHFDPYLAPIMEELRTEFPGESAKYLKGYKEVLEDSELEKRRFLINPMNYIGRPKNTLAPHYRIRVGSQDSDTSLMITLTLALKLMQTGKTNVDYEIVWDEPHGRADYPGEMTAWVKKITARN